MQTATNNKQHIYIMERYLFAALVFALTQYLVNAQCDDTTCTVLCYPVHWQRDLCRFYQELTAWRETVSSCGLTLPPLPPSRPGGPLGREVGTLQAPTEQWRVARDHWEELVALWQGRFDNSGQEPTVTPPPPDDPTPIDMTTDFDSFFSGSGSDNNDITTDLPTMTTEESVTVEPTIVVPNISDSESWDGSNEAWESIFTRWTEASRQGAGLLLPTDVDVGVVIDSYATNERRNRELWSDLVGFWRDNKDVYENSYDEVCPGQ